jgi:subtilisin family serine protease
MATYPIGDVDFSLHVVAKGFQAESLPHFPPADQMMAADAEALQLTPLEKRDLAAFRQVGWRFSVEHAFEAIEVGDPNGRGEIKPGLLARHRGGLVILQDRLVVQLKPSVKPQRVKRRFAKYAAYWPVERAENIYEVQLKSSGGNLEAALDAEMSRLLLEKSSPSGEVVFAEPSILYHLERPDDVRPSEMALPLPEVDRAPQWQWNTIKLREAWRISGRGAGVRIAVIDYGFHPSPEIPASLSVVLDDQGNVVPGGVMHPDAHGTLCAGLAGARLRGLGVNGAAPECELILVSVPHSGIVSQVGLSKAIRLCADPSKYLPGSPRGADVISCSLGFQRRNWELGGALKCAINFALRRGRPRDGRTLGCTMVWSVFDANEAIEPGSINAYKPILSVSQSDSQDQRIESGFGDGLDCIAPGFDVVGLVCDPICRVHQDMGSSLAAPCTAGVAALVLAVNPDLTSEQVAEVVTRGCDAVGNDPVPNPQVGAGRLNARKAVELALRMRRSLTPPTQSPLPPEPLAPPGSAHPPSP